MKIFFLLWLISVAVCCAPAIYATEQTIMISEFLPNPIGDDVVGEWIELYNSGSSLANLDGWVLSDVYGAVKHFSLTGKQIEAGEYILIYRSESQITMNNDIEQLTLTAPDGTIYSTAVFTNFAEGQSFSYVDGEWISGTPTPGGPHVPPPTPTPSPSAIPSPQPSASPTQVPNPSYDLQDIQLSEIQACGSTTEWVELYNPNGVQVILDDWLIRDSTTQSKTLKGLSIAPHGYLVKEWSGYFLNNTGDEVRLFHSDEMVESFTYESCTAGFTWAKRDDAWELTSLETKGDANRFSNEVDQSTSPSPSSVDTREHESTDTTTVSAVATNSALIHRFVLPTLLSDDENFSYPMQPKMETKNTLANQSVKQHASSFPWFISSGSWLFATASLLAKSATIKHAFNGS